MSDGPFSQTAPETTDFTPLISEVSQLLDSDLKARIRNDLNPLRTTSTANEEHVISAYDALGATMGDLEKAKKEIDALEAYCDAAEVYARQQLDFHSALKTYFQRTTDQVALRSESAAPIRRLPNEVLQLIFLKAYAQSTEKERYNPVTAQVCTFWRQLAEATPGLWTSINVNITPGGQEAMDAVAQMETRIKRAREHLVALRFSMEEDPLINFRAFLEASDSDEDAGSDSNKNTKVIQRDRHFEVAVTTLLKYTDRIESLHIPPPAKKLATYLADKCATEAITFRHLHTLSLYADRYGSNDFDTNALLKACPAINRLRIHEAPDSPHIRWETMKEFKGRMSTTMLAAFLSRAQNVQQAEITCYSWSSIPTIAFNDRLTTLALDSLGRDCATRLATTPRPFNLRHLSVGNYAAAASILLQAWGSGLEFVALEFDITAKDMKDLLPTIPDVQGLRLYGDRATPPNFFNLLPKLTHLEIRAGPDSYLERVRKLLARPLKPTSRGKQLLLRSVAFLPRDPYEYYIGKRWTKYEGKWESLYRELEDVGIKVHEYRGQTDDRRAFDTPFFEERE